jgi:hypothetical protein
MYTSLGVAFTSAAASHLARFAGVILLVTIVAL